VTIVLRDLLARMQSQAPDCVALLLVDLRDGTVTESCGDDAAQRAAAVARVVRDLVAPQYVVLPRIPEPAGAGATDEAILLSGDRTYVCQRLDDPPHHALTAICRGTRSLGLVVGLLRTRIVAEAFR
jgi:hypothetical protein